MTTIDHRILIPAAPDVVWDYISDITHNPDWQIDCSEVIFLTSRREGPGVRWRYSAPGGHEYVIAVTAWYNGLGYEYYFVDGVSYRENKGRIRLQEIPEGTIVQWTFNYELGGLFGGMRNALSVSRQVDHTISDSLKTLWQKVKESGAAARPREPKSLMRDAPDVDARSAYQPRHPSSAEQTRPVDEPPLREGDAQPIHVIPIPEPPISKEDTKPRRTAELIVEANIPPDFDGEPEFLSQVDLSRFEPPRDPSDTKPGNAVSPISADSPTLIEAPGVVPAQIEEIAPLDQPVSPPADETQLDFAISAPADLLPEPSAPPLDPPAPPAPIPAPLDLATPPAAPVSSESLPPAASIWEIFGLPRPSETQQMAAVPQDAEFAPPAEPVTPMPAEIPAPLEPPAPLESLGSPITLPRGSTRSGLRIVLRRKLVRLRRP